MTTLRVLLAAIVATFRWGWSIKWAVRGNPPEMPQVCRAAPGGWSSAFLKAGRVRVVVEGAEHLAPGRPAVLVANHESWFDVFALATHLPGDNRFVGKKELTKVPIFGFAWQACGHIAIDRTDRGSAIRSLDEAGRRVVEEGARVILFPEGTRSRTERMLPFKKGAFMLSLKLGIPVVPIGISGSRDVMAPGSWRIRPGTIRIRIGEPIPVAGQGPQDRDALMRRTRAAVEALRGGGDPTRIAGSDDGSTRADPGSDDITPET
jgi:1-acyl-sn-glycerol-3-phosphate acyltransferase